MDLAEFLLVTERPLRFGNPHRTCKHCKSHRGAGAVWPKCTYNKNRGGGRGGETSERDICAIPMMTPVARRGQGTCTRSGCSHSPAFRCQRRDHGEGLCLRCLKRAQSDLVGAPGRSASTDVSNLLFPNMSSPLYSNNPTNEKASFIFPTINPSNRPQFTGLIIPFRCTMRRLRGKPGGVKARSTCYETCNRANHRWPRLTGVLPIVCSAPH
jgi:hypothetical protein